MKHHASTETLCSFLNIILDMKYDEHEANERRNCEHDWIYADMSLKTQRCFRCGKARD